MFPERSNRAACPIGKALAKVIIRVYTRFMSTQCYCIKLRKASRKISALYDEALKPFGINVAQYSLMKIVLRTKAINLTDLAREAELERSTMGRNVQVLKRMGLLTYGKGDDQREQLISLSPEGKAVLDQALPAWTACQRNIESRIGSRAANAVEDPLRSL